MRAPQRRGLTPELQAVVVGVVARRRDVGDLARVRELAFETAEVAVGRVGSRDGDGVVLDVGRADRRGRRRDGDVCRLLADVPLVDVDIRFVTGRENSQTVEFYA
jgi:hypothetical protein